MKGLHAFIAAAAIATLISGCGLLSPSSVTVNLVNNGNFPVEVQIFVHDDQNVFQFLIEEVGEELKLSIPAGSTVSFTRDCDDLQAIMIADADLLVVGNLISPEADTDVLRDGSDFSCGDTLTFTFTHPDIPISLSIDFNAQ